MHLTPAACLIAIILTTTTAVGDDNMWAAFETSPHWGERILTYAYEPDVRVHINAPSADAFDPKRPTRLVLFALPNGNSIEWTVGCKMADGLDWHFDIQHIGAQIRRVREVATDCNWIVAYLESGQKSWPRWCAEHPDAETRIRRLVDDLRKRFDSAHLTGELTIDLTCHSGGGRFVLAFIDAADRIPDWVGRIVFLDANYGYSDARHADKLIDWLTRGRHVLCVTAYDDREMTYNGKPLVGPDGGTYRRTMEMIARIGRQIPLTERDEGAFVRHRGLDGRVEVLIPKNPEQQILHTVMVERNGLIHALTLAGPWENKAGPFWSERAYTQWIQPQ